MTAEQPGPAPRRLAEPAAPEVVAAEAAPVVAPAPDGRQPAEVATLEAPPEPVVGVPDDPSTGEPARPWLVRLATACCWLAVAITGAALLWVYWDAVPPDNFARASWLMAQFETAPGSLDRVLLAVAVTVVGLVVGTTNAIVGYYAWAGYGWTRIAGLISAALSFSALLLNPLAWAAVPLAVIGAGLLWLPPARRFSIAWHARRHPQQEFSPPVTDVYYGPLPRYR